ncbi:indoleacetamide hydrolase [Piscinibacter sp.]|uniref:indoleacetamide hydrolase n=1 Tax=Piscinibacter sp. TaxID=1903157 RepID=UPI002C1972EE|nr:indoleacetamide hydrolase [Albitalea sp.]HUG26062.1 indoleacetamide hydrolase [Albitalea sp.]
MPGDATPAGPQPKELTATQAVNAIAAGRLSAEAYVSTLLDRADKLSHLGAFITLNRAGALAAAKAVDERRQAGQPLAPLAGLPIVVKDNINTIDLPTTGATAGLAGFRPNGTAPVLQTLLNAGAIVLGKTNMHELAFGVTNTNFAPFAGVARNPYKPSNIPGGSSGGTGVAIAARIAPAGLGTDTGGSVRIPASLNGIAGLRPSVGNGGSERRYSGAGVIPLSHTRDTIGPLGRTVADIALLDAVITGTGRPAALPLTGLRFGVPSVYWDLVDNEVRALLEDAKAKLTAAGVTFVTTDLPQLRDLLDRTAFPVVLHEATIDLWAYLAASGSTATLQSLASLASNPEVRSAFNVMLSNDFGPQYRDAIKVHRPRMRALYDRYFADQGVDAIFFPTVPIPAPAIDLVRESGRVSVNGGAEVDTFTTIIRYTDLGSTVGLPGLTLPVGLSQGGLPVGMALDGAAGSDKKLLSIGLSMEALFGTLPAPKLPA